MMNFASDRMGVLKGDVLLFSDFENGGEMWNAEGDRERVVRVDFEESFRSAPIVHVSLSMMDMQSGANHRYILEVKNVTRRGFAMRFQTWADTKVARASASWIAIGEATAEDDWEV